jgi:hypothetical protein
LDKFKNVIYDDQVVLKRHIIDRFIENYNNGLKLGNVVWTKVYEFMCNDNRLSFEEYDKKYVENNCLSDCIVYDGLAIVSNQDCDGEIDDDLRYENVCGLSLDSFDKYFVDLEFLDGVGEVCRKINRDILTQRLFFMNDYCYYDAKIDKFFYYVSFPFDIAVKSIMGKSVFRCNYFDVLEDNIKAI